MKGPINATGNQTFLYLYYKFWQLFWVIFEFLQQIKKGKNIAVIKYEQYQRRIHEACR